VAYEWDDILEEWYVNDTRGLEHGYTLHRRPALDGAGGAAPLIFTLAVHGGLCLAVDADGRGVRFSDGNGAEVLIYTGLIVVDAEGRELAARFEGMAEGLRLSIDDRAACYPLTIDPIAQQAYLKASNTDAQDRFGITALSGDTIVVGAFGESSNATGVNGNQADNSAPEAGAVYFLGSRKMKRTLRSSKPSRSSGPT
jgi:trimeric autotransporter adhesin